MSDIYKKFEAYLEPGDRLLDLGCGSGRDSKYFLDHGYAVVALDPSIKMCEATALELFQEILLYFLKK